MLTLFEVSNEFFNRHWTENASNGEIIQILTWNAFDTSKKERWEKRNILYVTLGIGKPREINRKKIEITF